MNRVIKFRALIAFPDGNHWEYYTPLSMPAWCDGTMGEIIVKDLQFTGLHDKNGKEIYEGDILKAVFTDGVSDVDDLQVVTFKDGCFMDGDMGLWETYTDSEIIGNIYENPELFNTNK